MQLKQPFDNATLRQFYGHIPTGVLALAAQSADGPVVMAVSSFTTVSIEPALLVVSIRQESTTWPILRDAFQIGGSMLSDSQANLARQFASGKPHDRCGDAALLSAPSGAILVEGATWWFEGKLVQEHAAGDHILGVIELHAIRDEPHSFPLIFHRSDFAGIRRLRTISSRQNRARSICTFAAHFDDIAEAPVAATASL